MPKMLTVRRIFRLIATCGITVLGYSILASQSMSPLASDGGYPIDGVTTGYTANQDAVDAARLSAKLGSRERERTVDRNRKQSDDTDDLLVVGGRSVVGNPGDPGYLELPIDELLMPDLIPADVYYLWCGRRWFEFKNYLSVMSVRRAIQPDKIFIYLEHYPTVDRVNYNQWFEELKREYPWMYIRRMDDSLTPYCSSAVDRTSRLRIIAHLLSTHRRDGAGDGGIFVGSSTWLINFPPSLRSIDLDMALADDAAEGYVILRAGTIDLSDPDGGFERALNATDSRRLRRRSSCARIHHIYQQPELVNRTGTCFVVNGDRFDRIFPADVWELDDVFGRLARRLFYGTDAIRRPRPNYDTLVPNIGHMIWVGGGRMSYLFYLSVVSFLYVAGVDTVYLHGDVPPTGEYWDELTARYETKNRVKFIRHTVTQQVYQSHVPRGMKVLQSDIMRVDIMIKYGGVYTDTDAIWVQPLSDEERGYDAVASYDWVDWSWPFLDTVNFGVLYGKRTAPFWRIYRDSMRGLRNDIDGYTAVMMPYKLLEKYPHLLQMDRHLQVICFLSRCHPTYVNDYQNMSKNHVNMNYLTNWRQDVHVVHWTFPDPPELSNRSILLKSTGLFADIGRFVLDKAGLL